jgi:hypothetical protein
MPDTLHLQIFFSKIRQNLHHELSFDAVLIRALVDDLLFYVLHSPYIKQNLLLRIFRYISITFSDEI